MLMVLKARDSESKQCALELSQIVIALMGLVLYGNVVKW